MSGLGSGMPKFVTVVTKVTVNSGLMSVLHTLWFDCCVICCLNHVLPLHCYSRSWFNGGGSSNLLSCVAWGNDGGRVRGRNVHGLLFWVFCVELSKLWEENSGENCSAMMAWIESKNWSWITVGLAPLNIDWYIKWWGRLSYDLINNSRGIWQIERRQTWGCKKYSYKLRWGIDADD